MTHVGAFTLRDALTVTVVVGILAVGLWLQAGPSLGGTVVDGEVVGKREAIVMPLQDTWRQVFEISYTYRRRDRRYPATGHQAVGESLYDRLRVGSPVKIQYRASLIGDDSALAATSWWSRLPRGSETDRELAELAGFAGAAVLGFIAYRLRSRSLGIVAGTVGATFASSVLLLGFVVFPILFWAWRGYPGKGFGLALLGSMGLTGVVLYHRIPQPAPLPAGAQRRATAVVRGVGVVDEIWASSSLSGDSSGGQHIRRPFQMVDLEFTPEGRADSIHALDRVDMDSVPYLRVGATVPVIYSERDPRAGRMSVGTRRYGQQAAVYFFGLTYGIGAVIAFVVPLAILLVRLWARSLRRLDLVPDSAALERSVSSLPKDDPRRKAVERLIRANVGVGKD